MCLGLGDVAHVDQLPKQVVRIRLGRDLADEHRELAVRKGLRIVHRRSVDEQLGEQRVEWLRVLPEDPGKVINELLSERLQLHFPRPTRSLVHMLEQLDAQYGVEELKPRDLLPLLLVLEDQPGRAGRDRTRPRHQPRPPPSAPATRGRRRSPVRRGRRTW